MEERALVGRLVAVRLPPRAGWLAALEDIWDAGDAALPLPWQATAGQVAGLLDAFGVTGLLTRDEHGAAREEPVAAGRPVAAGTALVVATSGSTGAPKGVELTHGALQASTDASVARLGCDAGEPWLCCLPLHHVAGLQTLLRSRALGSAAIVHDGFDVGAVAAERDARWVSLVPTQLVRLLDAAVDLSHLRGVLLGGAAPPAGLIERAREAGLSVTESYGMTETCGGCVYDGRPLDGVEASLGPGGRIRIRGRVVMAGYRGDLPATAAAFDDGWLLTADRGRWGPDGRLEVTGRVDDVIVTGGENITPATVEAALRRLPGVLDAAVAGVPDDEWGEIVAAVVVPGPGAGDFELADLREALRGVLPAAALPRAVTVVEAVPRTGLGKPDAAALRALFD